MRNVSARQAPSDAPWYVVPADDKENARLIVSQIVLDTFEELKMATRKRPQSAGGIAGDPQGAGEVRSSSAGATRSATEEKTMYTNILIPTDGSDLSGKAVQHGIALAKRVGAKATVLTVLAPFHTFTIDTQMIEDTPARYKVRLQEHAEKTLGAAARRSASSPRRVRDGPGRARASVPSDH